ncbi:hypothetical protein AYI68_g4294 [Smittium mucronatum]|uniref:Uncharacterized protein n=1 Tax=Smittium mucronatum TaxID=133383 RepID=A0A1R0GXI3_9FUNG|nr:hypothetical protein AYI68_g4294 [Smittium mucronatum]
MPSMEPYISDGTEGSSISNIYGLNGANMEIIIYFLDHMSLSATGTSSVFDHGNFGSKIIIFYLSENKHWFLMA